MLARFSFCPTGGRIIVAFVGLVPYCAASGRGRIIPGVWNGRQGGSFKRYAREREWVFGKESAAKSRVGNH